MKKIIITLAMCLWTMQIQAELQTQEIKYEVAGKEFTGFLAYDDTITGKRPGVLVVHEWWGHVAYARHRAEMLAKLGYTAFALDMYGTGKVADHPDTAKKFMQSVLSDMPEAKKRFQKALTILQNHKTVETTKTAAMGYCFGGGFALQMARDGVDLDGVISVHGSLATQTTAKPDTVKAKILVLTGQADPFVPVEQVQAFEKEMSAAKVDYELISYPGVTHAFSNPKADDYAKQYGMPLAYDAKADKDAWQRTKNFLNEIFQ